jgi:hypothetical protein
MKPRLAFVLVAAVVVAAAIWYFRSGPAGGAAIPLLDLYPQAEKRSSIALDQAFSTLDVTIDDETRHAIFMHPTSRLIYKAVTLPADAWLRTWVALRPEVWDRPEGDGVLFRFGVSDGRTYDELVRQHLDPQHNPNDRRWVPLEVDLGTYGGLTVDLIFNTNSSLPDHGDHPGNDWAVWGQPEIFVRR